MDDSPAGRAARGHFGVRDRRRVAAADWVRVGKLVMAMPDASGEVAIPPKSSQVGEFSPPDDDVLAYFIVCPWEAVAVGASRATSFPSRLD